MLSNLPPSPEDEVILRARLRDKSEELANIHENMSNARSAVASAQMLIDQLSQSSAKARKSLETHEKWRQHTSISFGSVEEQPAATAAGVLPRNPQLIDTICIPLGPDVSGNGPNAKIGAVDLVFHCVDLHASTENVNNDLQRRQRLIVNVKSTSLKIYSLAEQIISSDMRELSGNLGAVRRVPDEIWYDILGRRIARDTHYWPHKKSKGLFLPSLSLSHVCGTWRRVIVASPSMWRAIHWNLDRGQQPNQALLELWASRAQDTAPRIYERLRHTGVPTGALNHVRLRLPSHRKLRYYIHQDRSVSDYLGEDQPTSDCPFLLIRKSKSSKRVQTLQRRLLKMFTAIETLCLEGIIPKRGVVFPESLTVLAIGFYGPHEAYPLALVLKERLTFLKLIHYTEAGVPSLEQPVLLPNLLTLQITPLEHSIAAKLILPSIESLRIFPQERAAAPCSIDWLDSLIPHCVNLKSLCLDSAMSSQSARKFPYDRLHALRYLRTHACRLRTLQFNDGSIDGSGLVNVLEADKQRMHGAIEELTIESCVGVSRMDCDRLTEMVDKLNVYRSFHSDGKTEQGLEGITESDLVFVGQPAPSSHHVRCSRLHHLH